MAIVKCFVVGCSRSGTTLLSVILDRHTRLAVPPETAFYRDLARGLTQSDRAQTFAILSSWHRLPELGLDARRIVADCGGDFSPGAVLQAVLSGYAGHRGKPFCGEKTPGHFRNVDEILRDFPNARVLFLVRDGRDVALSLATMPFWKKDLAAAAALWQAAAKRCRAALDTHPDRVCLVRYERLVSDPEPVVRDAMCFIGLPFEPSQLDHRVPSGVVLSRSLAWKGRALGPIDGGAVLARRDAATADELQYLEETLAEDLRSFGYPVRG